MNKSLLTYKVCYSLGVSNMALEESFKKIHQVAKEIHYFDELPTTRKYRALCRIYFMCIRYHQDYSYASSLKEVSGERFVLYAGNYMDYFEELFASSSSLESFLSTLAMKAKEMCFDVYRELKPGLPFPWFSKLLALKEPTSTDLFDIQGVLRNLPADYNIYFCESVSLNNNILATLKKDTSLLKRMRVMNKGNTIPTIKDESILAASLEDSVNELFLHPEDFREYACVLVDDTTIPPETLEKVNDILSTEALSNVLHLPHPDAEIFNGENICKITGVWSQEDVDRVTNKQLGLVVLTLPQPREVYQSVMNGDYENVYLLSTK